MATVEWSKEAVRDLDAIADYIERFDRRAATDVAERLFALGESLAAFPDHGHPDRRDMRALVTVRPYVILYRVKGDRVTILRVRHGRRRPLP